MKRLALLYSFVAAIVFTSCASTDKAVPYTVAKHYFLKNTVSTLTDTVITDHICFDELFGMATTMGPDGNPTPIDFTRQFIIAVATPETSASVDLHPVALNKKSKKLVLDYTLIESGINSYTLRPLMLLVVDRTYLMAVVLRNK